MDRAALAASLDNLTTALKLSLQNIGDQMGRLKDDDALRLTASDLRRQSDEKAAGLTDLPVRLVIPLGKFRLVIPATWHHLAERLLVKAGSPE